jgi:hypothetical protein
MTILGSQNDTLLETILRNNKRWAVSMKQTDPDFFFKLSQGQTPSVLWIGWYSPLTLSFFLSFFGPKLFGILDSLKFLISLSDPYLPPAL